jgi:hypothetical protein
VALAVVKVIHEFGHGLSCKMYGGEVHEMGLLFLCFSPAMFCNVSDAWKMPNKWHRIVISFAGIYVELIIAALATFVWWNTESHPFIHNLSLSLMVVCSVSTVVFNANPLMRYDGYYVLADWLEIPNLREKSNRYLMNVALDKCLGIEVVPEPYMALWRRILFVTYAIVSWLYRWIITFTILYFMYNFLRPYKLQVISSMLTLMAIGSMVGWPLYRLGKNLRRRGRLPDMKRWRVVMSGTVLAAIIGFLCFVPVPISRVRGQGLVEALPEIESKVYVKHPGTLVKLKVRDGQPVKKNDELAEFVNRDLEIDLALAETDWKDYDKQVRALTAQYNETSDREQQAKIADDRLKAQEEREKARNKLEGLKKTRDEELKLLAPRDGVVRGAPRLEDVGKFFDHDPEKPFCTIAEPRRLRICFPVETTEFNQIRENVERTSSAATATRRRLQNRVAVAYERRPLGEVLDDLAARGGGKPIKLVRDTGVTDTLLREPVTLRLESKITAVLERVLGPFGLGYVVVSDQGAERDGAILIRAGRERGYAEGPGAQADLEVTIRIQGRDSRTWKGRLERLPESEARTIPLALSSRAGGPIAVKPGGNANNLVPQTQYYLVYIDIIDPDDAIMVGNFAQVKIHCQPETCLRWAWRKINGLFDLGLM